MDNGLQVSMLEYYNERAPEYDEAYTLERVPVSISDLSAYKAEVTALSTIVERIICGRLIDIACGTAHWLPHYASRCSHITLFDQSQRMLSESRRRAKSLRTEERIYFVLGNYFVHEFKLPLFDCALIGFLLSHLTSEQEHHFFGKLESMLKAGGKFLFIDSAWTEERAKTRKKEGKQERVLNDGRRFDIYKKYFDKDDISSMERRHRLRLTIEHLGRSFIAVSGNFDM